MQSFLIIHPNPTVREAQIQKRVRSERITPFDVVTLGINGSSIGIQETKSFMRNLALAPLEGNLRAGVIPHADLLTIEAQQSLLKSLEEPPKHAYIFLGASSTSVLLPTIVSRCHIIPIVDKRMDTKEEINKTVTFVTTLLAASPGEKIRMIESVGKNKEAYVLWIDRTIGHLHAASEFSLLRQLLNTKQYVGNNVNPLLLIEHVVLAASGTI